MNPLVRHFEGKTVLPGTDPVLSSSLTSSSFSTPDQHYHLPHIHQAVYYNSSVFLAVDRCSNHRKRWIVPKDVKYSLFQAELMESFKPSSLDLGPRNMWKIVFVCNEKEQEITISSVIHACVRYYHIHKKQTNVKHVVPPDFIPLFSAIERSCNYETSYFMGGMHPMFTVFEEHEKGYQMGSSYVPTPLQKVMACLMLFNQWWQTIEHHTPAFMYEGYCEYFLYCIWSKNRPPNGLAMNIPVMTNICHSNGALKQLVQTARDEVNPLFHSIASKMGELRQSFPKRKKGMKGPARYLDCLELCALTDHPVPPVSFVSSEPQFEGWMKADEILTPEGLITQLLTSCQLVTSQRVQRFVSCIKSSNIRVLVFYTIGATEINESMKKTRGTKDDWMVCRYRCSVHHGKLKTALVISEHALMELHLSTYYRMQNDERDVAHYSRILLLFQAMMTPESKETAKECYEILKETYTLKEGEPVMSFLPPPPSSSVTLAEYNKNKEKVLDHLLKLEHHGGFRSKWCSFVDRSDGRIRIPKEISIHSDGCTSLNSIPFFIFNTGKKREEEEEIQYLGNKEHVEWWYLQFLLFDSDPKPPPPPLPQVVPTATISNKTMTPMEMAEFQQMMNDEPQYIPPPPPPPPPSASSPVKKQQQLDLTPQLVMKKTTYSHTFVVEDFSSSTTVL